MTAEEFIKENLYITKDGIEDVHDSLSMVEVVLIDFAKMHVKKALEAAKEKATMNLVYPEPYQDSNETGLTFADAYEISRGGECGLVNIDKNSILNAYPENLIT